MDRHGQAELAEYTQQLNRVRVVEGRTALVLSRQANPVYVDRRPDASDGVRSLRMGRITQHEPLRGLPGDVDNVIQGDPASGGCEQLVLVRAHLVLLLRDLPGEEPHLVDALLVHVLEECLAAVAVIVRMVVGVDQQAVTSRWRTEYRSTGILPHPGRLPPTVPPGERRQGQTCQDGDTGVDRRPGVGRFFWLKLAGRGGPRRCDGLNVAGGREHAPLNSLDAIRGRP